MIFAIISSTFNRITDFFFNASFTSRFSIRRRTNVVSCASWIAFFARDSRVHLVGTAENITTMTTTVQWIIYTNIQERLIWCLVVLYRPYGRRPRLIIINPRNPGQPPFVCTSLISDARTRSPRYTHHDESPLTEKGRELECDNCGILSPPTGLRLRDVL